MRDEQIKRTAAEKPHLQSIDNYTMTIWLHILNEQSSKSLSSRCMAMQYAHTLYIHYFV